MSLLLDLIGYFIGYLILTLAVYITTVVLRFRKRSILRALLVAFILEISAFLTIIPILGLILALFVSLLAIKAVYEEGWLKSIAALIISFIVLILLAVVLQILGLLSRTIFLFRAPLPSSGPP